MEASTVSKLAACALFAVAVFPTYAADAAGRKEPEAGSIIIDTAGLPPHVAQKVREKASEGLVPLVRYLHLNRMIFRVGLEDLVVPNGRPRAVPQSATTVVLALPQSPKPD